MVRRPLVQVRSQQKKSRVTSLSSPINENEVAQVAYRLFVQRGHVHGHDFEDWLEAERIVRQREGNGKRR